MLVDRQSDGSERHILVRPSSDSAPPWRVSPRDLPGTEGRNRGKTIPGGVGFFGGVVERLGFVLSGGHKRERSPVVWPWAETPPITHIARASFARMRNPLISRLPADSGRSAQRSCSMADSACARVIEPVAEGSSCRSSNRVPRGDLGCDRGPAREGVASGLGGWRRSTCRYGSG